MIEKLRYFIEQVRAKNGEHEQALLRIMFVTLIFTYLQYVFEPGSSSFILHYEIVICIAFFVFSLVIALDILLRQKTSTARQWIAMFVDVSACTFEMMVTGESSVIFFGIYLWVIVGNGLRYGPSLLLGAYLTSIVGFASVIAYNSYWIAHLNLTTGLIITLALIPLYVLKLRHQLSSAVARAEEASQAKSRFLANMSHEMRTPLNGVIGASELIMETKLSVEQKEIAGMLKNSSQLLLRLIENVLDLSKIESGKITTETVDFDLYDLINSTVAIFNQQAKNKNLKLNVRFTPETCFLLCGDLQHLRQVIINLVGNAIKFTPSGLVEIRISTLSQDDTSARLRFEVVDTGIGIAPEARETIFESFQQADDSITRHYGGTGLGTTIAKQLISIMGGEIGFQSEVGIGTIFWFELPFGKQSSQDSGVSLTSLDQLRVIAVGIPTNDRLTVSSHLAGWGVQFEHEASLARFFTWLAHLRVDRQQGLVILCSPENFGMNPLEFAANIRDADPQQRIHLILLSSSLTAPNESELLAAGYSCILSSPVDKTLLFNRLHNALTSRPTKGAISLQQFYTERNSRQNTGSTILVAEDNGTNRKIISKMLQHGGHKVELAENGEQALDMLEERRYDLVILDMNMPMMGGLEVIKIHRATHRQKPATPVIILTANATIEARRECEEAGVEAYLTKPVETQTLLDTVARLTLTPSASFIAEEAEPLLPEVADGPPYVNEKTLHHLALLGKQGDFIQTVIHGFVSESEKIIDAMHVAIANQDFASFRELAHMMKGSSGNVGAEALHQTCCKILNLDDAGLRNQAQDELRRAQNNFRASKILLIQYLGNSLQTSIKQH